MKWEYKSVCEQNNYDLPNEYFEILYYLIEVSTHSELFSVGHFFHSKYEKWLVKAKKKYRRSQTKGNHNYIKSYLIIEIAFRYIEIR